MTDDVYKQRAIVVLEGEDVGHLARILHDWLDKGFQVDSPRQRFADALFAKLVADASARRV